MTLPNVKLITPKWKNLDLKKVPKIPRPQVKQYQTTGCQTFDTFITQGDEVDHKITQINSASTFKTPKAQNTKIQNRMEQVIFDN